MTAGARTTPTVTSRADSHIHLFSHGFSGPPGARDEVAMYEALREQYNISHALVVGYEGDERYRGNNDELEQLAHTKDWVVPLAFVNTDGSFRPQQAERRLDSGFRGFSVYLLSLIHI